MASGYGVIGSGTSNGCRSKNIYAHRLAWERVNGLIPKGLDTLHKCDNRRCINPDHLFPGTKKDNADDAVSKGRNTRGEIHGMSKLSEKEVKTIRAMYAKGKLTQKEIGLRFGIKSAHTSSIITRKSWKHI